MTFIIDPNLRDVLEEITSSSESAILAGSYLSRIHQAYTIPDGRFAAIRLGLGSADRHLLDTYRSELATVLIEGFHANYFGSDELCSLVDHSIEVHSTEQRDERARFARDSAPKEAFVGSTGHWLRRLLEGRPISNPKDLEALAVSACRLTSKPAARICHGLALMAGGHLREMVRTVSPVTEYAGVSTTCGARSLVAYALREEERTRESRRVEAWIVKNASDAGLQDQAASAFASLLVMEGMGGQLQESKDLLPYVDGVHDLVGEYVVSSLVESDEGGGQVVKCAMTLAADLLELDLQSKRFGGAR